MKTMTMTTKTTRSSVRKSKKTTKATRTKKKTRKRKKTRNRTVGCFFSKGPLVARRRFLAKICNAQCCASPGEKRNHENAAFIPDSIFRGSYFFRDLAGSRPGTDQRTEARRSPVARPTRQRDR